MDQSHQSSQKSQKSQSNQNNQSNQKTPITFLPQHGHYRHLRVYQVTEMIYDITFYFTQHYLSKGDRTVDQMVQAARSGKQNIAEGNQAAATSSETEIKLTNVAKASLEELLDDYEDYLRVRNLQQWGNLHPRYEKMREYARGEQIRKNYAELVQRMTDEEIANLCITLIHQAIYMLHKLLVTMQDRYVKEGGIKERMYQSRVEYRSSQSNPKEDIQKDSQKATKSPEEMENRGKKWSKEDDERLWAMALQGTELKELAKEFDRSRYAIYYRLRKLGYEHPVGSAELMDNYNKFFAQRK